MDRVNVTIKFFGPIVRAMNTEELTTTISADREKGLSDIRSLIRNNLGEGLLYSILIGGSSIDLTDKEVFDEHEVFSIIPIVLGG